MSATTTPPVATPPVAATPEAASVSAAHVKRDLKKEITAVLDKHSKMPDLKSLLDSTFDTVLERITLSLRDCMMAGATLAQMAPFAEEIALWQPLKTETVAIALKVAEHPTSSRPEAPISSSAVQQLHHNRNLQPILRDGSDSKKT